MDRSRQARWDIGGMRTVSCRVPTEVNAALMEACRLRRTTRHAVLCEAVARFIREVGCAGCPVGPPEAQP